MAVSTTAENCKVRFATIVFGKGCFTNRIFQFFNLRLHRLYCIENEQGDINFFGLQVLANGTLIEVEVEKSKTRS